MEQYPYEDFAKKLSLLMEKKNNEERERDPSFHLSSRKLANEIGISPQALVNYQKGLRMPPIDTLQQLANYFNVSIEYFTQKDKSIPEININVQDIALSETALKNLIAYSKGKRYKDKIKLGLINKLLESPFMLDSLADFYNSK